MKKIGTSLRKFADLSFADKLLFVRVLWVVSWVKLTLRLLPFAIFKKYYLYILNWSISERYYDSNYSQKVADYVRIVSARLPFAILCLPQALAVKYLLRHDKTFSLKVGVKKDHDLFEAHAWVEQKGKFVIGETPVLFSPIWEIA